MIKILTIPIILLIIVSIFDTSNVMRARDSKGKLLPIGQVVISPGESITLECNYNGTISWSRRNKFNSKSESLTFKEKIIIYKNKLTINNMDSEDTSIYYCENEEFIQKLFVKVDSNIIDNKITQFINSNLFHELGPNIKSFKANFLLLKIQQQVDKTLLLEMEKKSIQQNKEINKFIPIKNKIENQFVQLKKELLDKLDQIKQVNQSQNQLLIKIIQIKEKLEKQLVEQKKELNTLQNKFKNKFQQNNLKILNIKSDYANALRNCQNYGMHLIKIQDDATNQMIYNFAKRNNLKDYWVFGSRNRRRRTWVYTDGKILSYTKWYFGQPDDAGNRENCINGNYLEKGYWNDDNCSLKHSIICYRET